MSGRRALVLLALLLLPLASALGAQAGRSECGMTCCRRAMPGSSCPARGVSWLQGCPAKHQPATASPLPEVVRPPVTVLCRPLLGGTLLPAALPALLPAFHRLPYRPPRA
jgi:hypothetical protein